MSRFKAAFGGSLAAALLWAPVSLAHSTSSSAQSAGGTDTSGQGGSDLSGRWEARGRMTGPTGTALLAGREAQARRSVMTASSAGAPSRAGGPVVPTPRFT
jgi:hypothetical protein